MKVVNKDTVCADKAKLAEPTYKVGRWYYAAQVPALGDRLKKDHLRLCVQRSDQEGLPTSARKLMMVDADGKVQCSDLTNVGIVTYRLIDEDRVVLVMD